MNGDDNTVEVVRKAERTVYHTQWRVWEELALEQLARTAGLARAPLLPGSEAIQLVTGTGNISAMCGGTGRPALAGAGWPWR